MKISIPHPVNTHKLAWPRVSLLDRYIIQELIPTFLFGIGLFTSIALTVDTVFDLVRQVAESGLDIGVALRVFLLRMPEFIVLAFPMSMVLATLMVYSRLSSDSELVALRSCGVSLYRLVVPTLILSLLVTALTFAFNELIVPATNYQATTDPGAGAQSRSPALSRR